MLPAVPGCGRPASGRAQAAYLTTPTTSSHLTSAGEPMTSAAFAPTSLAANQIRCPTAAPAVSCPPRRRAGRRHHGLAHRRPSGQRRHSGAAARSRSKTRLGGPATACPHRARSAGQVQTRRALRALARRAHHARHLRRRPAQNRRLRLGDRGCRRESRNQDGAAGQGGPASRARTRCSLRTPPACPSAASPRHCPAGASASSARTSSIRRATCGCWS